MSTSGSRSGVPHVIVGSDGSVRAGDQGTERLLRERAGTYEIALHSATTLILRDANRDDATRLLMAGEVVSRMTMLEVINVIANSNWRGILTVRGRDRLERSLTLDQGAVKYARSSRPDDLLGEVLFRKGILTRDKLNELLREITPDKRFGELCIERQVLDQEQLFNVLREQCEQIFFGTLLVADGVYQFVTIDEQAPAPAHTLHIPIQGLLMEGVQRIDEMALFRERIPNNDLCPTVRTDAPAKELDQTAKMVLLYCDGERTIGDIARLTGRGEFLTTKAIYHLLQQNQIELHSSTKIDRKAVRRLVSEFNDVLRDIFMAVATYGGIDDTRNTLSAWIQGSGYGPYFGDEVDVDGSISMDQVLDSVDSIQYERPLEAIHQALHELAAFALFSATTTLPRDQELTLARDVNRRLKAIRI
ncbi:MAG: DUF4388 domain-containing protein [Myxococcota bacterium]